MSPVTHPPKNRANTSDVITYRQIDRDATALAAMDNELDLESLVFNWISDRVPDMEAIGAITGIAVERTIEGASTVEVTMQDPDNRLFAGSRVWEPKPKRDKQGHPKYEYDTSGHRITRPDERGRSMEIKIDGIVFRLVKVSRSGTQSTLTFEDRVIWWLRRKHGAKRAKRSKVTRAQFILSLLREINAERVRFVCPELNVRQPIDKHRATRSRALARASTTDSKTKTSANKNSRGIADAALTVKGRKATPENRRIGQRVLAVADQLNANAKATLALMEAVIVESEVTNTPKGDASSVGVLQLLNLHGSASIRMDVEWCCKKFLQDGFTGAGGAIALAKRNPGWSAGTVAWHVQGPATQYRDRYDQVQREATAWVQAYAGSGADVAESDAAGGATRYRSYQFAREGDEDSWTCIQRLATEIGWRCYMQGRSMFYMSEADLYRRQPQYVLKPDDGAVLQFDYDVDWGKTASEASVQIVAGEWKAPPGEPILVEGWGPPDGRWLVTSWRRDYFSPVVDLTIKQPAREKMEPAPEAASSSSSSGSDEGTGLFSPIKLKGLDVPKAVVRAYNRASAIDSKDQRYSWGGGHGSFNDPGGYDCSGFVSSCLGAAGIIDAPEATGGLVSWGQSGPGKYMTVYVKENGNPHMSHTFIVFTLKGKTQYAEAGGANSGHTGWHAPRSHAGFVPRHYPGT
jgi:hypothetical protein